MKKVLLSFTLLTLIFLGVHAQFTPTPWYITGNGGTNPSSNFIGTTDRNPLIFKTNNTERMQLLPDKAFLGIGTSSPLATLHLHYPTSMNPPNFLELLQLTTYSTGIGINSGFSILSHKTTNDIYFKQQESAKFFLEGPGGGLVVAQDGNVGLGTDNPQQKVHIDEGNLLITSVNSSSSDYPTGALLFDDFSNTPWCIEYLGASGLNFRQYSPLSFSGAVNSNLFLSNNQKVGIGTQTPSQKLHVKNGNIIITGPSKNTGLEKNAIIFDIEDAILQIPPPSKWGIERVYVGNKEGGLNFWKYGNYVSRDGDTAKGMEYRSVIYFNQMDNVGIGTTTPQVKLEVAGDFKAQSAEIADILTANLHSQDAVILGTLTANNFSFSGNLGLGTSSPQEKLHIKGENLLITQAKNPTTGFRKSALVFDMVDPSPPVNPSPFKWGIEYVNSSAEGKGLNFWKYYYKDNGPPDGDTTGTGKGWIYTPVLFLSNSESNNVGIGTTSPNAKLEVAGDLKAQSANITGKTYLDGDVGIGTNKPKQKLHIVNGNILISKTSSKDLDAPGSTNGSILFGADIDNNSSMGKWGIEYLNGEEDVFGLNFWRPWNSSGGGSFNYGLFLADNGDIGIGKNNPGAKLDVNGTLKATNATVTSLTTNILNVPEINLDAITTNTLEVTGSSTLKGTVTVGTTPHPADLDVTGALSAKSANIAGILKTKKMQVTTTGWPDYVFDKEYELLSLSEVAQFIDQNSCLPNIPSAREVEENGLDIGEMQSKLLQKIEELTLYIIQLEKRLSEIENRKGGE